MRDRFFWLYIGRDHVRYGWVLAFMLLPTPSVLYAHEQGRMTPAALRIEIGFYSLPWRLTGPRWPRWFCYCSSDADEIADRMSRLASPAPRLVEETQE